MITEREITIVFRVCDGIPQTEIQIKADDKIITRHMSVETVETLLERLFYAFDMGRQMYKLKERMRKALANIK